MPEDRRMGTPERDIAEVIRAVGITQRELEFQVRRLKSGLARPSSVQEQEYFETLIKEYAVANETLKKLWGYHTGRMERLKARQDELGHSGTGEAREVGASGVYVGNERGRVS